MNDRDKDVSKGFGSGSGILYHAFVLILIFLMTGLVVYQIGRKSSEGHGCYKATAIVYQQHESSGQGVSILDAEQKIASEANLDWAIGRLKSKVGGELPSLDKVRRDLSILVADSSTDGGEQISISYRDAADANLPVKLVNELAERYVQQCRAGMQAKAEKEYDEARLKTEKAKLVVNKAKALFDEFLKQHFEVTSNRAAKIGDQETPTTVRNEPRMVQNKQWIVLRNRVGQLAQYRTNLLDTRTTLHPEVNDIELSLEEVRQQLAATPKMIPAKGTSVDDDKLATADDAPKRKKVEISSEDVARVYAAQKEALDRVEEEYRRLALVEEKELKKLANVPGFSLSLAVKSEFVGLSDRSNRLWVLAAIVGLAMSVGTGMFSAGMNVDPTFRTISQAQTDLSVPIVGVIPVTESRRSGTIRGRRIVDHPLLVAFGLALISVGIGVVVAIVRGY